MNLRKLVCLGMAFSVMLFAGCDKDKEKDEKPEMKGIVPEAQKTEDVISKYVTIPLYLSPNISNSVFGKSVSDRCKQSTSELSLGLGAVIISDTEALSFSDEVIRSIVAILHNGGKLVYILPSANVFKSFASKLVEAQNFLIDDGLIGNNNVAISIGNLYRFVESIIPDNPKGPFAFALSIYDNNYYVIGGQEDNAVSASITTVIDEETGEKQTIPVEVNHHDIEETPYECGLLAEYLIEWLMDDGSASDGETPEFAGDVNSVEPHCQNVKYDDILINYRANDNSSCRTHLSRCVPLRILYNIWSAYDIEHNCDVYMMKRYIKFEGSKLDTGPTDKELWWVNYDNNAEFYGPYLTAVKSNARWDAASSMDNVIPRNAITSTNYSESKTFGISGGVSIGKSPSIVPGISYSKSVIISTQTPDLATNVTFNNTKPEFRHYATSLPDSHWGFSCTWHDLAKDNYHQDLEFNTSWNWIVENPKSVSADRYKFEDNCDITINMLGHTLGFFKTIATQYEVTYHYGKQFAMDINPHYDQLWGTEVVSESIPKDKMHEFTNWIQTRYGDYWSIKLFHVPAYSENDRDGIKKFRNDFINVLAQDQQIWRDFGYTGTFNFTWRLNSDAGQYYTYQYVVNP